MDWGHKAESKTNSALMIISELLGISCRLGGTVVEWLASKSTSAKQKYTLLQFLLDKLNLAPTPQTCKDLRRVERYPSTYFQDINCHFLIRGFGTFLWHVRE